MTTFDVSSEKMGAFSTEDLQKLAKLSRPSVLELSDDMKMAYFFALQVKHLKLELLAKDLTTLLSPYNETNILFLIGSTGVGKTSLILRLLRSIVERFDANADKSSIPFIYIAAPANGEHSLSWVTIYERIMARTAEVQINQKQGTNVNGDVVSVNPRRYKTLSALREALEQIMRLRRVRVLVFDEAVPESA